MAVFNLNLYRHPSGVAFDPDKVLHKARAFFPEADMLPGDQLANEVQFAERFFAQELASDPTSSARYVIGSLRRKAQSYGPAYAFVIPRQDGSPIRGLARSVNVQFLVDEPLSEGMRDRLLGFLRSLGVGRLEVCTGGARQFEVLCDLRGPSDYLSERPSVPWTEI